MKNSYSERVCSEVVEILEHIPKQLYDRVPAEVIDYFYQNADEKKSFVYNTALPITEQSIDNETLAVLNFLNIIFWQ